MVTTIIYIACIVAYSNEYMSIEAVVKAFEGFGLLLRTFFPFLFFLSYSRHSGSDFLSKR